MQVSYINKIMLLILFLLCMIKPFLGAHPHLAKNGCLEKCGDVTIPYPFGIGLNCSIHNGFAITCNHTFRPPKPFLRITNLEVLKIELDSNEIQINNPIWSSGCSSVVASGPPTNLSEIPLSPFSFSASRNRFVSTSCNNFAKLTVDRNVISGCMSICNDNITKGCDGINCCKTTLAYSLKYFNVSMEKINENGNEKDKSCNKKMFVADQEWVANRVEHDFRALEKITHVPTILEWRIDNENATIGYIPGLEGNPYDGRSNYCAYDTLGNYRCVCEPGFEGNPYLPNGCEDIDECTDQKHHRCQHYCLNHRGYYSCYCETEYISYGEFGCTKITGALTLKFAIPGTCIGFGFLFMLIGLWWLRKLVRRRKQAKRKEKFFRRNGGMLLQQQISSDKGNFEATKLFTSKELEKATENYNINRVLGQGGQGTVYKGMLTDGKIVAVKKAKVVDEGQLDVFINEVVILSQINHRNIVKLLGCCLETEVPMLVYEYIPNGTLYQYIHNQIEEFPLSWELRLRIASEVAGALSYLHSAASVPIYHRDIKSSNILLDEKYRAKVSDFGTSRSIAVDQTHLTTGVKGTFGYLDPEYFQSSQFTEKSDVYSFGVVLVELLTGYKAISLVKTEEWRGLAGYFMLKMEKNRLFDILDSRVAKEGEGKDISVVANLALRCLNLNGRQRPTMRDVLVELESKLPKIDSYTIQNREVFEYPMIKVYEELEIGSSSSSSFFSLARD